jgi:5,10-methylenetetrahydromethanopterin reductase
VVSVTASGDRVRIGVMFRCATPAEELPEFARRAEAAGFDQLWVVEDCFYSGGVAAAAAALAATTRVTVGIGILPAVVRNAAFIAMEFATLARLYPGRFAGGLGHGMPGWMAQVGAAAASPLTALEESVDAVRSLLRGDTVTAKGRYTCLNEVTLAAPPAVVPPVYAGVRGARSLELAGRAADGTILAEPVTVEYLREARQHIAKGAAMAGRGGHHPVVAYSLFAAAADPAQARAAASAALRRALVPGTEVHLAGLDFAGELITRLRAATPAVPAVIDDDWVDQLTVSGTPGDCAERISALHAAGADSVCLIPTSDHEEFFTQSAAVLAELEDARR